MELTYMYVQKQTIGVIFYDNLKQAKLRNVHDSKIRNFKNVYHRSQYTT